MVGYWGQRRLPCPTNFKLWERACSRIRGSGDGFFDVHIHSCGNDCYWFRSYSGLLGKAPSNQALLPLSFGASLVLGMPSFRSCSVGPPPSAIHGRGRLPRHPCRGTHCAEPPLGLSRGRSPQQQNRGGLRADRGIKRARFAGLIVRTHSTCNAYLWACSRRDVSVDFIVE
ncbi:hypothetical protein PS662_01877 [Pseudomonas fluorescens]|uniref:Uncharacterized protein n=1 Tax=Pseudomonas fluorescens TaxID=294 RepID=A0A5E6RWQ9_PSEFL|nr:hypothetical protein PS662_01877 [Pseudomonas fluorescens]